MKPMLVLILLLPFTVFAGVKPDHLKALPGRNHIAVFEWKQLDGNQVNCTVASDGPYADSRKTNGSGLEWPKGTGKTAIYTAGMWLAGLHRSQGTVRVSCIDYNNPEYQPGPLLETFNTTTNEDIGPVVRAGDSRYRLYKVLRSHPSGDPDNAVDAWSEWPGDLGAPYVDGNGNGQWDSGIDAPLFSGDMQMWCVTNDVNRGAHASHSTSSPLGLEMQVLYYELQGGLPLGNTMYVNWRIINKSDTDYDSVYIGLWSDPDLGGSVDDLPGCDTLLSMGYVYNGNDIDGTYGTAPPAAGFLLLQGPIVPGGAGDTGWFNGQSRQGFRNLPPSSFTAQVNVSGSPISDPPPGNPQYTPVVYDYLRGMAGPAHADVIDPNTSLPMKFWFSGDPVAGIGNLPSNFPLPVYWPQDIRMNLNTGPFTLAQGDTQEIVMALVLSQGTDRLNSVTQLKTDARKVRLAYYEGAPIASIAPVESYQPTNVLLPLIGSASVTRGTVSARSWTLAEKPAGSSASIASATSDTASITPDTPGLYRLIFMAEASSGLKDTATLEFTALSNRPPSVTFSAPSQITLGDSIRIDGSAISDPDSDPLTITWNVDGGDYRAIYSMSSPMDSSMGILLDGVSKQTVFHPYRTSRFDITVEVRDPYYTRSARQSVTVLPIATPGYSVHSSYTASGIGGLPSYGFTAYGPIREFDGQIWYSTMGSLFAPNFSGYGQPSRAYPVYPGNYAVHNDIVFVSKGRLGIDIMRTDYAWNILSMSSFDPLHPVRSTDTTVVDVYYRDPILFFAYGVEGIYACDMSNLSSPVKVGQYANGDYWGNFVVDGDFLYGLLPRTNRLAILDITNPLSMGPPQTVSLEGSAFTLITKIGDLVCVAKPESIAVYDVSTVTSPVLLSTILLTKTHLTSSRFWTVGGYGNHLLAGTHEGTYIYDISSPSVPTLIGRFITGYAHPRVFLNERRMILAQADWLDQPGRPERLEGYLEFDTPITGAEEPASRLPGSFALHQNYPNPFNPATLIRYELPAASHVTLSVFDMLGRRVATLVEGVQGAGAHQERFDASGLATGVYHYRLQAGDYMETRKMIVLR